MSIYLATGFLYATKVPKWNAPDEPAHFNYIVHLAATGTLPVLQLGDYDQEYLEQLKSARFPPSMPIDEIRYESHQPPLYYALAALVYLPLAEWPLDRLVLGLRSFSLLLGAVVVLASYALARAVVPGRPWLALGTAAFVATVPQHVAMTSVINNDPLATLLMTCVLLVLVGGWRDGFSTGRCLGLGGLLGLALITKLSIYVTVLLAGVALLARASLPARSGRWFPVPTTDGGAGSAVWRAKASFDWASFLRQSAVVYGTAALLSGWWFVRNVIVYGPGDPFGLVRHDLVVHGQPRTVYDLAAVEYFVTTIFRSFWAQFGWMGVLVDSRIYAALALISAIAALGLLAFWWRSRRGSTRLGPGDGWSLGLLALAVTLVFGSLIYYNLTYIQAQGRYLFYVIAPIGLFFTIGLLEWSPRRLAPLLVAGMYLGLLALAYVCLLRFIAPYFGTA